MNRLLLVAMLVQVAPARADCERVEVWADGRAATTLCRDELAEAGATPLDLGDAWLPAVLARARSAYAPWFVALANERFADAGPDAELAPADRYLELFGIPPSFAVIRARLADTERHACHAAVAPLGEVALRLTEEASADGRARLATARSLRVQLEHARDRAKLADLDALAETSAYYRRAVQRLAGLEARISLVRAIQAHLACDGLFASPPLDGAFTWQTTSALERFQRGVLILPTGTFDEDTFEALAMPSRERDVRAALRVLRERVIAASGLVEDGTAADSVEPVLGRALVPAATWRVRGQPPLADAAPDLIDRATEAAARALGWTDAETIAASLARLADRRVAVRLPPPPAYHGAATELAIEIDRGDATRYRAATRRPALIVYARDGERRIALARWPTTVGGWQDEKVGDAIISRWKESPAGPRVWRELYVAPRWLPPTTTPDRELVRATERGVVLARQALGPSYRAAFGLVAFVHVREERTRRATAYDDQGIRTHGTGNLTSLARGVSHGCHRLLGMYVVRLAGFVIAHHETVATGPAATHYRRAVRSAGKTFPVAIDTLGDRIELIPPISVDVRP